MSREAPRDEPDEDTDDDETIIAKNVSSSVAAPFTRMVGGGAGR